MKKVLAAQLNESYNRIRELEEDLSRSEVSLDNTNKELLDVKDKLHILTKEKCITEDELREVEIFRASDIGKQIEKLETALAHSHMENAQLEEKLDYYYQLDPGTNNDGSGRGRTSPLVA